MANQNPGYAGSIGNTGVQSVKAPCAAPVRKGRKSVKKGEDLRNGK